MSKARAVAVAAATMWTTPEAPRPVDSPVVADDPDVPAWVSAMDEAQRRDLHGRTLTQLLPGEPVEVLEEAAGWARVVAPWQGSALDPRGYPGWVRTAHLGPARADWPDAPAEPGDPLDTARGFLGLTYIWGGTSGWGLDCSGLVHLTLRRHLTLVPRDACDQAASDRLGPVPVDDVRAGDLYFFARPGKPAHHVGFVAAPLGEDGTRMMLHASPEGSVREEPMTASRLETLVAAGRFRLAGTTLG